MLQDWAAIATIVGFPFVVCPVAVGVIVWFVRRCAALPEQPFVDFTAEHKVDSDGVRWVKGWIQSASTRAYVHDVCCEQCLPSPVPPDKFPKVSKASERKSLLVQMIALSKRKNRDEEFAFKPQYLTPNEPVEFWVSCPLWIKEIELVITMSVGRFCYKKRTFSQWCNVPDPYDTFDLELGSHLPW